MRSRFFVVLTLVVLVGVLAGVLSWPYFTGVGHTTKDIVTLLHCDRRTDPSCD